MTLPVNKPLLGAVKETVTTPVCPVPSTNEPLERIVNGESVETEPVSAMLPGLERMKFCDAAVEPG